MNVLNNLTNKDRVKIINILIKLLSVLFVILSLFWVFIIAFMVACHFDGLRELFSIDNIECYGESYDVAVGLFQFYGLLVLGGVVVLLRLKSIAKHWEKQTRSKK